MILMNRQLLAAHLDQEHHLSRGPLLFRLALPIQSDGEGSVIPNRPPRTAAAVADPVPAQLTPSETYDSSRHMSDTERSDKEREVKDRGTHQ